VAKLRKTACPACGSKKVFCGPQPKQTNEGDPVQWLLNGDTGTSSMTIWSVMMKKSCRGGPDVPYDPDDFGRCYRLLKVMPSWRARLPEVSQKYSRWKGLVDNWDELTALYEEGITSSTAPKLYARIKELIGDRA
jgi:hypothetical protein